MTRKGEAVFIGSSESGGQGSPSDQMQGSHPRRQVQRSPPAASLSGLIATSKCNTSATPSATDLHGLHYSVQFQGNV